MAFGGGERLEAEAAIKAKMSGFSPAVDEADRVHGRKRRVHNGSNFHPPLQFQPRIQIAGSQRTDNLLGILQIDLHERSVLFWDGRIIIDGTLSGDSISDAINFVEAISGGEED